MSYDSKENSVDLGSPVTLFEFIYGETLGDAYRYATTVDQISVAGRVWEPHGLVHSEISSAGTLDKAQMTVEARPDIAVAKLFMAAPPSQQVVLNIWRGHAETITDGWDDFIRVWTGRVLSAEWQDGSQVEFKCEPVATSAKRIGLRRNYQYGCPHVLYGRACGLSQNLNSATGRITSVQSTIEVSVVLPNPEIALTPSRLVGGIFTLKLPTGRKILRSISSAVVINNGFRVTLLAGVPELAVGLSIELARGCQHTFEACGTFSNTSNYGGCPNIPTNNPFRSNTF